MTEKAAAHRQSPIEEEPDAAEGLAESREASADQEPGYRSEEAEIDEAGVRDGASPESVAEAKAEEALSVAMDRLQGEFDELNDRHLRLAAEFSNYRRRQENEMAESWSRAQADLVRRLLDVLDDLQRVSRLDPADEAVSVEAIVEGVDLVERKFLRMLEEAGVDVISPEGEPFDPATMEAMMRVPADSKEDDDLVAAVFQNGYRLKGHLVRPARVSVFKSE